MPQQDKEITDILGIPRLTIHSWKTGSSHTKLLYAILKRMSANELRAKKEDAEEFFNLLVVNREELYQKLYDHKSLQKPMDGYKKVKLLKGISIANKDDMVCLIEPTVISKNLIVHYIVKGSHNKSSAQAFIQKMKDLFQDGFGLFHGRLEIHLYGTNLKEDIYVSNINIGPAPIIKTYNINEVLGIDKELVVISNTL